MPGVDRVDFHFQVAFVVVVGRSKICLIRFDSATAGGLCYGSSKSVWVRVRSVDAVRVVMLNATGIRVSCKFLWK